MASPLIWHAWQLSGSFYSNVLRYSHKLNIDGDQMICHVETRIVRLIPFYMSFIPLLILQLFSVITVRGYLMKSQGISMDIFIFNVSIIAFILLSNGLNWVFIRHMKDLCELYFNALVAFESTLHYNKRKPANSKTNLSRLLFKRNYQLESTRFIIIRGNDEIAKQSLS